MRKLILVHFVSILAISFINAQIDKGNIQINSLIENDGNKSTEDVCSPHSQQGSADLQYYTEQYIMTNFVWHGYACQYMTKDISRGAYLYVRNFANGQINDFLAWDNTWPSINDRLGTTALWCIERTYDYFYLTFQRNSWNNSGGQVNIYVNVYGDNAPPGLTGDYSDNCTWYNNAIYLGTPGNVNFNNNPTTLDVIAHEFTHGIAQYEINLSTTSEAGAINESFANIFGYMVDYYAKTYFSTSLQPNYAIGEECHYSNKVRYFDNPHAGEQPKTYGVNDPYWYDYTGCSPNDNNDNCGVHKNCGIQNYWFYLLCEGGSDINANGNEYCVLPIGRDKAAKIAYYTLTQKITTSNPTYTQIRNWSIEYTQEYYGQNSNEVAQVTNAWYAVGVGPSFSGNVEYNNLTVSGTQSVSNNSAIEFNNFNTTPSGNFTVTSNTRITMKSTSRASSGSYFHAYITQGCSAGAKVFNTDYYYPEQDYNTAGYELAESNDTTGIRILKDKLNNNSSFSCYPNPNKGIFTIYKYDNNDKSESKLEITGMLGNSIYKSKIHNNNTTIDISNQPKGIYLVKITSGNELFVEKVIIQ